MLRQVVYRSRNRLRAIELAPGDRRVDGVLNLVARSHRIRPSIVDSDRPLEAFEMRPADKHVVRSSDRLVSGAFGFRTKELFYSVVERVSEVDVSRVTRYVD